MRPICFLLFWILPPWMLPAQPTENGPPLDKERAGERSPEAPNGELFKAEQVAGDGVWVDPTFEKLGQAERPIRVTVWFDKQFLGDGNAYRRRAKTFADWRRTELRTAVERSLKSNSATSFESAKKQIEKLTTEGKIRDVRQHWIVNGFSCTMSSNDLVGCRTLQRCRREGAPIGWDGPEQNIWPDARVDVDNSYGHQSCSTPLFD